MGGWLTATNKSYDVAITKDSTGSHGRLHHLTYFMESREDVLKMADILREKMCSKPALISTPLDKHSSSTYLYEPGGDRIEVAWVAIRSRPRLEAHSLDRKRAQNRSGLRIKDDRIISYLRHTSRGEIVEAIITRE